MMIIIILLVGGLLILLSGNYWFERSYQKDVLDNMLMNNIKDTSLITEEDLKKLPELVQKYLRYVGVVGKPRVNNLFVVFKGWMREKGKKYFSFNSEQYNFFNKLTRLFFMKGKINGLIVPGYHKYWRNKAMMDIKLFGWWSVVKYLDLFETETVTLLNDICLLAPAVLLDSRITWKEIDSNSVKVFFVNQGVKVTATLFFNESGQLVNFISDDRLAVAEMKKYRFSTPVGEYKNFNGYNLPGYGEAIWHYPDGDFVYGKFYLQKVEYNCEK